MWLKYSFPLVAQILVPTWLKYSLTFTINGEWSFRRVIEKEEEDPMMRYQRSSYQNVMRSNRYRPILVIVLVLVAAFLILRFAGVGGLDSAGFEAQRNAKIRSEMQHALSSVNNLSRLGATSTSSVLARVRQYVHGIEVVNDLNVSMYGEVGRLYDVSVFDNLYAIIDNYDSCLASGQKVNDALSKLTDAINELNTLTNAVLNNTSAAADGAS